MSQTSTSKTENELQATAQWFLSGQIDETRPVRQYAIHRSPFAVGRRSSADLSLAVGCISKNHAEFEVDAEGSLILRDLDSTNGTFVNGDVLKGETSIVDGDLIQFATIVFRVSKSQKKKESHTIQEDACDHALSIMQFDRLISDGGLFPHFQPIVKLEDQSRIGYEVLGRSRLFGLQTPDEMFTAASQLNLEAQLSEAFRLRGVEIGSALGRESNLFLNTHPKELDREGLYDSLRELREADPEQSITLEIHEAAVTNLKMMKKLCNVLKDLNIKLAFDDFGVGQARLVELGDVRPDYLKFDMKLTKNINHAPPKRQEVVALFAKLVNNLGIQTLAEGVETRECHDILVQMGFQLGQGYYYGRPSPVSKYLDRSDATRSTSLTDIRDISELS